MKTTESSWVRLPKSPKTIAVRAGNMSATSYGKISGKIVTSILRHGDIAHIQYEDKQ